MVKVWLWMEDESCLQMVNEDRHSRTQLDWEDPNSSNGSSKAWLFLSLLTEAKRCEEVGKGVDLLSHDRCLRKYLSLHLSHCLHLLRVPATPLEVLRDYLMPALKLLLCFEMITDLSGLPI